MTHLAQIAHAAWLANDGDTGTAWDAAVRAVVKDLVRLMLKAGPLESIDPANLSPEATQIETRETRDARIARCYERYVARLADLRAESITPL
jgi:hypothetical protein